MKKIYILVLVIIISNNMFSQDSTKFILPLEVGNKWQFIEYSGNYFDRNYYNMKFDEISNDTLINGHRYFLYWRTSYHSTKYLTRYGYDSNTVYISVNDTDRQVIDYKKLNGQKFYTFDPLFNTYYNVNMEKGKVFIFNDTINYAAYGLNSEGYYYGAGVGLYRAHTNYIGPGGSNSLKKLIRAVIYDSLGNYNYYTDSNKCIINYQPIADYRNDSIEILTHVNHAHTYKGGATHNILQVNFTDSVWVEYFFRKDDYSSDTIKLALNNIDGTIDYKESIYVDSAYLINGFKLVHRIIAKDKSLIPAYSYTPFYSSPRFDSVAFANKIETPLQVGNKYQYVQSYSSSDTSYTRITYDEILRDTVINGKKYYFNWDGLNYKVPTRYDYDSNTIYIFFQGEEKQIVDFRLPDSSYFDYFNFHTNGYQQSRLFKDTITLFGNSMLVANFEGIRENLSEIFYYAKNIGRYKRTVQTFDIMDSSFTSWDLIRAIIFDTVGNYSYLTDTNKSIINSSFNLVNKDTANIIANVTHGLSVRFNLISFVDTVWLDYYYKKGNITTNPLSVGLKKQNISLYQNKISLNTNLLNDGYGLYYKITAEDVTLIPQTTTTGFILAEYNPPVNVDDKYALNIDYSLGQNYPNPFNPVTTIKYAIEKPSNVVIKIFDVLGNEVTKLVDEPQERGYYSVDFDASRLASGIYYYSISAGEFYSVKKMVLIK